ncbi:MAG: pilus assembly protein TadG-related protein [bacterium]
MKNHQEKQRGNVLVMFAVSLTLFFCFLAMSVDIGWIMLTKSELQAAADSAALAGAAQLTDEDFLTGAPNQSDDIASARDYSQTFSSINTAAKESIGLDRNDANETGGGVVVGYVDNPLDLSSPLETSGVSQFNTVQVVTRRTPEINGPLQMFLGFFTNMDEVSVQTRSAATLDDRVIGFDMNPGEVLGMLPFTVYEKAWDAAYDKSYVPADAPCPISNGGDLFNYDESTKAVTSGNDGVFEIHLYPNKADSCKYPDAPGNFGTLDVGYENNSADDLDRQIRSGCRTDELALVGNMMLEQDVSGKWSKWLNGDTGVSATIKAALESIKGQARILPLHSEVVGTGDTAYFKIVRFVGVRIVDVKMTGALEKRHVTVQPACVVDDKAVFHPDAPHSNLVFALSLTR